MSEYKDNRDDIERYFKDLKRILDLSRRNIQPKGTPNYLQKIAYVMCEPGQRRFCAPITETYLHLN